MAINEKHVEDFVCKYVKDNDTVSVGTSHLGETFVKKIALECEEQDKKIRFVPSSTKIGVIASQLGLPIANLNEEEIDIAIEFVDLIDEDYNFIKRDSTSLVRDKMIAQSAAIMVGICEHKGLVKKLKGSIPFEIAKFGYIRTISQLENLGKAKLRMKGLKPYKTETDHYLVDVDVDEVYSLDDLEYQAKAIPGVLETGMFIGMADRMILHNKRIQVKSRTEFKEIIIK